MGKHKPRRTKASERCRAVTIQEMLTHRRKTRRQSHPKPKSTLGSVVPDEIVDLYRSFDHDDVN